MEIKTKQALLAKFRLLGVEESTSNLAYFCINQNKDYISAKALYKALLKYYPLKKLTSFKFSHLSFYDRDINKKEIIKILGDRDFAGK